MDLLFMQNELNRKCCAPSLRLLCENQLSVENWPVLKNGLLDATAN